MNSYFSMDETVFDVTERYPETIRYLAGKGFTPLTNPVMRKLMGKKITLEKAFLSKKLDIDLCERELVEIIEQAAASGFAHIDLSLKTKNNNRVEPDDGKQTIRIEGVLPCPIRIPLLESFEAFYSDYVETHKEEFEKKNYKIRYDLRSANLGIDWIIDLAKTGKKENLPDVLLSAGFELFFDKKLMGSFIENKEFHCALDTVNKDFCNDYIDLRDEKKNYAIIGVVPAIMIVNTALLDGRKMPETWEDILSPEFEHSVAIPFGDLDLFNSVILNIYARFGDEGIKKLGKACSAYMHPAQMVKGGKAAAVQPVVSISPYFFSKMIDERTPLKTVWPEDGAIVAPIFMLVKKDTEEFTKDFVSFFLSEKTGTVFAQSGFFPSTNPSVDNRLSADKKFSWVGWDFIYQNDIGVVLEKIKADFETAAGSSSESRR
ncbi:iron ABC transporter substrate-binding protein [Treponema sp. OMZ 838]|uniref:ABC transporter substrate-binding protein n=1 Tax=Treponema sp. OMZ 838 TaxID=1539298 RepID=UPI0005300E41|nr:ABC transporter substrate-binding protein [Treponema sp. OMZ 838]AIW88540.1 iron ABC transporter substrate-binding protein [Treponema sp. OMZ 838]